MDEENSWNSGLLSAGASFRELYYGAVAGAVPFEWESRPGTPKKDRPAASSAHVDPDPLTPPPSYYGALGMGKREARAKYSSRSGRLIHAVVLLILRRFRRPASSSSASSNSRSSSFSSFSFSSCSSTQKEKVGLKFSLLQRQQSKSLVGLPTVQFMKIAAKACVPVRNK